MFDSNIILRERRTVHLFQNGYTRDVFPFEELCELRFPIPDIEIQKDIVNIYKTYIARKGINEKLKEQISTLCPILIKGSIEEAS